MIRLPSRLIYALVPALALLVGRSAAAESLALRINDAEVRPGQNVVLVVRTYAPRPLSQGQLFLRATSSTGVVAAKAARGGASSGEAATTVSGPFLHVVDVQVVSSIEGDVTVGPPSVTPDGQAVSFGFASVLSSVNAVDGPLAILTLALSPDVVPGQVFVVTVSAESSIDDADDKPVVIDPRPGELTILFEGDPMALQMDRLDVWSGSTALVEVSSLEPRALSGATITVDFDPAILAGALSVEKGPLQGALSVTPTEDPPGRLSIVLDSPDGKLNEIPGALVRIHAPTASGIGTGTRSAILFDVTATELDPVADPPIAPPDLVLENGELRFTNDIVFCSDFEKGDLTDW